MYPPSIQRNGLLAVFVALITCSVGPQSPVAAQVVDLAEQARVDRDKLASEVASIDGAWLRNRLLQSSGNDRLARWYTGEVLVDQKWLTLEEAQQQAAEDKRLTRYRKRRTESSNNLSGHERLARWCEKKKLTDLAHMHWLHVLRFAPNHQAALSELGLRWHHGFLLAEEEVESAKEREREWLQQNKTWLAKVKRLRRDLEKGEPEEQLAARKELRAIHEPAAVPALIEEFAMPGKDEEKTLDRQTELLAVLGGISSPEAVETLAQFAVESPDESLRYAAIDQLKTKPLETYAPALLAGMAMPVEASVTFNEVGNRVVSSYTYSQDGAGDTVYETQENSYRVVPGKKYNQVTLYRREYQEAFSGYVPGRRACSGITREYVERPAGYDTKAVKIRAVESPGYAKNLSRTMTSSRSQADRRGNQIADRNMAIQIQNERIATVLTEVTGETLSAFPKSWWNWWSDYLDQHPDVATVGRRQHLNSALLNQQPRGLARGTWIWTRRGKQPIETVKPGDYVLAQDPRTGELAYQVVLNIAQPQEMAVSKVELESSELFCAPAHVVWMTGRGWQRVSKLFPEASLHGATAEAPVTQVDKSFEIDCYDLIVDGSHTFFVGEQGVLVHDATPIGPTHVALPGFSPAAVAEAANLAVLAR